MCVLICRVGPNAILGANRDEVYDRDSEQKGIAEVLVRKHRNGPIGDRTLFFREQFARFEDLQQHDRM